ncbi:MAG: hypothetical protein R3Y46_05950 [Opitutales bacterium]
MKNSPTTSQSAKIDVGNPTTQTMSEAEILKVLKEAHKSLEAQKSDFLKRKISKTIEHALAKNSKLPRKTLPESLGA